MANLSLAQQCFTFIEDAQNRQALKVLLLVAGLFLLFFMPLWKRGALTRKGNWALGVALVLVAALSVAAYFEFGWKRYGRYMNPHDVYHYYMGAKYSPEHGYFDLYRCALIADTEMNREFTGTSIRNLRNHDYEPASAVRTKAAEYKAPFTEARWAEFKKDLAYFQACVRYDRGKFEHMVRDKGYNATPVWNTVARWLAELAPTPYASWQILRDNLNEIESHRTWTNYNAQALWQRVEGNLADCRSVLNPANAEDVANIAALDDLTTLAAQLRQTPGNTPEADALWGKAHTLINTADPGTPWPMRLLTYIDLVFLLVMFAFVWWAFGWRVMLLAIIFHGTNYFMNFVHIKGAFMRLDWVCLLVIAICLLKKRFFITAGAAMAYAGMARMFPFVFLFGVGAVFSWKLLGWLWGWLRRNGDQRPFPVPYVRFFASAFVTSALLVGITWVDQGDLHLWKSFFQKIEVHNSDISTTRVGFKYALLGMYARSGNPESVYASMRRTFEESRQAYKSLAEASVAPDAAWWQRALGKYVLKPGTSRGGLDTTWHEFLLLRLFVLALLFALLWIGCYRLEAWEAVALSFVAAYLLAAPTFYYYVMLIVPLLFFLPRLELTTRVVGAALVYVVSIAAFFCVWRGYASMDLHFLLSMMLLGFCAYMVYAALSSPGPDAAPAPAATADDSGVQTADTRAMGEPAPEERAGGRLERLGKVEKAGDAITPGTELDSTMPSERKKKKSPLADFVIAALAGVLVGGAVLATVLMLHASKRATPPPPVPETHAPAEITPPPKAVTPEEAVTPAAAPALQPGQASLVLVGDVMLSRNVEKSLRENHRDFTFPFQKTAPWLRSADIAFANLECPVSGRGEELRKNYTFNAPPECVEGLVYAGFDVLSLANNHTLDYGPVALADTFRLLNEQNIRVLGLSTNEAPQEPVIVEANGVRVGFLGYCDPVPPYSCAKEFQVFDERPPEATTDALERDIAALRPNVDVLVVSLSWGVEYTPEPTEQSKTLGRFIIDQGADIVAGHHPHVQHEPELYNGGLIIYSMGNFVFDQWSRPSTRLSRLYRVIVDKQGLVSAEYLPLEIPRNVWQPTPVSEAFISVGGVAAP